MKVYGVGKVSYRALFWQLCVGLVVVLPYQAIAEIAEQEPPLPDLQLLSPQEISQKLLVAAQEQQASVNNLADTPTALIDQEDAPLELDVGAITRLPTLDSVMAEAVEDSSTTGIDPSAYIPEYQSDNQQTTDDEEQIDTLKDPNIVKRLYNRLFNDWVENVQMAEVVFYDDKAYRTALSLDELLNDEPKPVPIRTIDTEQLHKIDKKTLKQQPYANIHAALSEMTAQSVLDFRGAMPRIRQAVKTASQAVGYYDMDFSISRAEAGVINVIIHDVGEPVRVDNQILDIRGSGADNPAYQTAKASTLQKGDVFDQGKYEASKSAVVTTSGEHGYFDARWLNSSADVILPDNIADVSLVYDTGEQYAFDDVVFFTFDEETGSLTTDPSKLPVKSELLRKLVNFNMGDAYNRTAVRNLSNSVLATGYFNAVNTETVLPSKSIEQGIHSETTSEEGQIIELENGITADIAPIEFTPSQDVTEKLAMVVQKANRLYNAPDDRVLMTDTSKKSKSILGRISDAVSTFAKAILPDETKDVLPELEAGQEPPVLANKKTAQDVYADKKVPLYIFVMSDKPRDAQLGLGWGSDTGTRLTSRFKNNLLNRHGMQAGIDTSLSANSKAAQVYVTRPLSHPLNDVLRGSLTYGQEQLNQGAGNLNLSVKTLEMGLSRNLIKEGGWNRVYSIRYHLDELDTRLPRELWQDLPIQFVGGKPTQEAVLAGVSINKTTADNPISPMRGYRQYYSLELGSDALLSDTNMAIAKAGISGVYSFGDNAYGKDRAHQLIGSLRGGYLWASDFNDVPYKLRFFAGGDQSIRGFNYNSLSPLSDKGYLLGGQSLAVASAEYNYEIMENIRLGAFVDAGNAYDERFSNDTKIGAGVGVRWASPVGQVRIDVATPIGEEDNPIKLYFFVGTPF